MLIDTLKKASMEALKTKDKEARAALSVVINKYNLAAIELKTQGKEITDADLVSIIAKTLKELADEKEGFVKVNRPDRVEAIKVQEDTLKAYLPKMLSEDEIKEEILKLDDKSIPSVMKHFKQNFAGKVDMGLVNKVARSI
ncbi:MAG: GatB/YqeY domain-containing protein [Erysipelotrichaceae bacterium]|nr:GatB/YqeY domain-containing protein [Erysipelotrichaceae bacterium]